MMLEDLSTSSNDEINDAIIAKMEKDDMSFEDAAAKLGVNTGIVDNQKVAFDSIDRGAK